MITPLFTIPLYMYEVKNWNEKKELLLNVIGDLAYQEQNTFQTDRGKADYSSQFEEIFQDELVEFLQEVGLTYLNVKDVWTLKYSKPNENHCPHNHSSTGYTGILCLEHDPEVHPTTTFIGPWNDPIKDQSQLVQLPNSRPGMMYIWPSFLLHYVDGMQTDKERIITSWDMELH